MVFQVGPNYVLDSAPNQGHQAKGMREGDAVAERRVIPPLAPPWQHGGGARRRAIDRTGRRDGRGTTCTAIRDGSGACCHGIACSCLPSSLCSSWPRRAGGYPLKTPIEPPCPRALRPDRHGRPADARPDRRDRVLARRTDHRSRGGWLFLGESLAVRRADGSSGRADQATGCGPVQRRVHGLLARWHEAGLGRSGGSPCVMGSGRPSVALPRQAPRSDCQRRGVFARCPPARQRRR